MREGHRVPPQEIRSFAEPAIELGAEHCQPSMSCPAALHYSRREQIYLVIVTLLSFPFLYISMQIPKYIVNTITGTASSKELFGLDIALESYLLVLCGGFLVFIFINGWFKLHINVKKGQVGERMLRRLRYELYERLLRFPLNHFDRTASGATIAMMTGELEPVGGFVGEAFALPISPRGHLAHDLCFHVRPGSDPRGRRSRLLSAAGLPDPQAAAHYSAPRTDKSAEGKAPLGSHWEDYRRTPRNSRQSWCPYQLADIANRLGEIYDIRLEIYNRKFFVKLLNNFIGNLTPFFFYTIGGYLVIKGELSIGALTAAIAAFKELSSPWKELLDFYRNQQDVAIKYEQVVEQFNIPNMLDRRLASIRSSNRKLYSASSKRVACSPTASLATISETRSSASPATVTTPTRRSPPICCSARRSTRFSKAMGSLATPMCRAYSTVWG